MVHFLYLHINIITLIKFWENLNKVYILVVFSCNSNNLTFVQFERELSNLVDIMSIKYLKNFFFFSFLVHWFDD